MYTSTVHTLLCTNVVRYCTIVVRYNKMTVVLTRTILYDSRP